MVYDMTRVPDWLYETTGRTTAQWVARVQALIRKHSRPSRDPKHDQTDAAAWVAELAVDVMRRFPGGRRDENLWAASVMGVVLANWYLRCHRAKAMDPCRPVRLRKRAYARWLAVAGALHRGAVDESLDPRHFPGQRWENPWLAGATDGTFT